jgi:hypothetical protein
MSHVVQWLSYIHLHYTYTTLTLQLVWLPTDSIAVSFSPSDISLVAENHRIVVCKTNTREIGRRFLPNWSPRFRVFPNWCLSFLRNSAVTQFSSRWRNQLLPLCQHSRVISLRAANFPRYMFRPPLWSSGQSSWLQMQGSRVRFPGTTKKVVGLERGPLSLVSTTEELLDRKIAAAV